MSLRFIKKNLVLFIVCGLILALIISFVFVTLFQSQQNANTPAKPVSGGQYSIMTDQSKKYLEQDHLVGLLIKKLPYQGKNFNLTYDSPNNKFTATIKVSNQAAGTQELNDFLKQKQIDSTDWLPNFTVKNE